MMWFIPAVLLFVGVLSMPSVYYDILRWIVFLSAAIAVFTNYQMDEFQWAIGFGIVALIFNPILPLYLYDKFMWMMIDIIAGLMFLFNIKIIEDEL